MTKIYAIFDGDYSDYHHVASFSTKEKADAFSIALDLGPDQWEEIELDNPLANFVNSGLALWSILMKRDGTVTYAESKKIRDYNFEERSYVTQPGLRDRERYLDVYCFARDKEHAIKIAGEKRTQSILQGRWE